LSEFEFEGREVGREIEEERRRELGREREVARGGTGESVRARFDSFSLSLSSLFLFRIEAIDAEN
jgi:hypothetical protein